MHHVTKARRGFAILMLLPATTLLAGLTIVPVVVCVVMSLTNYSLVAPDAMTFMFSRNEFLFAMVRAGRKVRIVPVGLYGFAAHQQIHRGSLPAAALLMLLPVLALVGLFQRHLIRGLTMGAIR